MGMMKYYHFCDILFESRTTEVYLINTTFDWSRLGDISIGREHLGAEMPVAVYRLMHYTLMDEMTRTLGKSQAEELMRRAGFLAGQTFAHNVLTKADSFSVFLSDLQAKLKEMKIGILRMEKADIQNNTFVLTLSEDLDCSGLPVMGDAVCVYDEGFLAGIFFAHTGRHFRVEEVDCWATGDRTCRFHAQLMSAQ